MPPKRFDEEVFRATHNSYSGGERGSIVQQLDVGVRFLEYDFHDKGFPAYGDYRLGHLRSGMEVAVGEGGNPESLLLRDWLCVINEWSDGHPGHAPITVALDSKGDLTDNDRGGDLEDLNCELESVFGSKLYTPEELGERGEWPEVSKLGGRILAVLSGNGATRTAYRWAVVAPGSQPQATGNAGGDVVLAYRSESGDVSVWSGRLDQETVRFGRKSSYPCPSSKGSPSTAITLDGWVVLVCGFGVPPEFGTDGLVCAVGQLDRRGQVDWRGEKVFARGFEPTLTMEGDLVRVVFGVPGGGLRSVQGRLNRLRNGIDWLKPETVQRRPEAAPARAKGVAVRAYVGSRGLAQCAVGDGMPAPVRYRQVLFVEQQRGDPDYFDNALFFAAPSKDSEALHRAKTNGRRVVVRGWGFEEADCQSPSAVNLPATDQPRSAWYARFTEDAPQTS